MSVFQLALPPVQSTSIVTACAAGPVSASGVAIAGTLFVPCNSHDRIVIRKTLRTPNREAPSFALRKTLRKGRSFHNAALRRSDAVAGSARADARLGNRRRGGHFA